MRKLTDRFKWLQLLFGLILIGAGVVTIIMAANGEDDFDKNICLVWSIILFVIAFLIVLLDILAFGSDVEFTGLIAAGLCVGVGVFILVNQDIIRNVISSLIPYILISIGGVLLLKTIMLAIKRVNFKKWIVVFIVSVIFLTSGIVFICVSDMLKVIYIVIGGLFIVLGGLELVGLITRLSQAHHDKKVNAVTVPKAGKKIKKGKKKNDDVEAPVDNGETVEAVDAQPKELPYDDDVKLIEQKKSPQGLSSFDC